jgi:uncharacterized damage-inducible protein DinB
VFTVDGVQKLHSLTHASLTLLQEHLSTIPPDGYEKQLPTFGFPSLQKQVIHIFNCEGFWISTLQETNYIDRQPVEFPAVADAGRLQREVSRRTREYLSGLSD